MQGRALTRLQPRRTHTYLRMHIYTYICTCACRHVGKYTHDGNAARVHVTTRSACLYACICVEVYTCMHPQMQIFQDTHMHVHVHTCMYMYTHACTCTHMHVHVHTCIFKEIHTHIQLCTSTVGRNGVDAMSPAGFLDVKQKLFVRVGMYVCTCVYVCLFVYMYIYVCLYTCMCVHVCVYVFLFLCMRCGCLYGWIA
jgi:hypothetical protein